MKKQLPILFLFFLVIGASPYSAQAGHDPVGCEITYRCIDSLNFEVSLVLYRDCRSLSFSDGFFNLAT